MSPGLVHTGTWGAEQLLHLPMAVSSAFPILPLPQPAATLNLAGPSFWDA